MAVMATNRTAKQMAEMFIQTHDAWVDSPFELLTDDYEQTLKACVDEFKTADLPSEMRDLNDAVIELGVRYEAYEDYVTKRQPMPRQEFWAAVQSLKDAVAGQEIVYQRTPEPVSMLLEQGVSYNQIAQQIYGHNGEGPFLTNGVTNTALILKECKAPGSVVGDWVHPNERNRVTAARNDESKRIERLAVKANVNIPVGRETFEELFQQGVPVVQIADIKQCSIEQVMQEAKKFPGMKVVTALNTNAIAPHEPMPSPERLRSVEPMDNPTTSMLDEEPEAVDAEELDALLENGEEPEDAAIKLKTQVAAMYKRSGGRLEADECAKAFGIGKSKAARLIKQVQNEEPK